MCERQRKKECACLCLYGTEESVCVSVCVRDIERYIYRERQREKKVSVCVSEKFIFKLIFFPWIQAEDF